jgi:hypothetical protein
MYLSCNSVVILRPKILSYSCSEKLLFKNLALRATPAVVSILSLYVYYSATLYLFFQTNSLAALSIYSLLYLNIHFLFFYSI